MGIVRARNNKSNSGIVFGWLARERSAIALLVALLLVVLLGATRRRDQSGVRVLKIRWHNLANVVVAGDSRIGSGVSPKEMARFMMGRIVNYSFGGVGYSKEYLAAIESVLVPAGRPRTIILGISPQSLTPRIAQRNTFTDCKRSYSFKSVAIAGYFDELLLFTAPLKIKEAFGGRMTGNNARRIYGESFADGWTSAYAVPEDQTAYIPDARKMFDNNQVTPEIIANLMLYVVKWRGEGIDVYAFRPPTVAEMVAIENVRSGFDEHVFASAFEKAGGIWLDVDQFGYHCYDGSHLHREGAIRFSQDLARMIAAKKEHN